MKKNRIKLFITLGISLLSVGVCSIATFAWFQIESQPLETSLVSGSSDVEIQKITGYKVDRKLNAKGFVDYTNNTIVNMDADTNDYSATINTDKERADTEFDVPNSGIGYYLVKQTSGSFKFSSATYYKFNEYSSGNTAYIEEVYFDSVGSLFRIRSYQMNGSNTDLQDIVVSTVTYNGTTDTTYVSNGDVSIPAIGTYKVWLNKNTSTIGLEFLSSSDLTSRALNVKPGSCMR